MSDLVKTEAKLTAFDLERMIRKRHSGDAWVVLSEVSNSTGFARSRSADVVALGTWPSRGLDLHGFEIKVSRSDLLSELAKPEKADGVGKYCSYWWLVVSDAKLVEGVAIPGTWGVLAPRNKILREIKKPERLEAKPWTPAFAASLIRNYARGVVSITELEKERAERDAIIRDEVKKARDRDESQSGQHLKQLEDLQERVRVAEQIVGCDLHRWDMDTLRAGVAIAKDGCNPARMLSAIERIKMHADSVLQAAKHAEESIEKYLSEHGKQQVPQ